VKADPREGSQIRAGRRRNRKDPCRRRAGCVRACRPRGCATARVLAPEVNIDTAGVVRAWNAARTAVLAVLRGKQAAPLDAAALPENALAAITAYDETRGCVAVISNALQAVNPQLALVKEQAAAANLAALSADLAKLKAVQARFDPANAALCQAYLDEKAAKTATETLRDQARAVLDQYRQNIFPA
jgi:hypothetical protein